MEENHIKGEVKQVKGSIKEAIGKITGDKSTQAEGAAEKAAGRGRQSCRQRQGQLQEISAAATTGDARCQ
jgi:uncharacterized protein YjbJ (UPF0337 family)